MNDSSMVGSNLDTGSAYMIPEESADTGEDFIEEKIHGSAQISDVSASEEQIGRLVSSQNPKSAAQEHWHHILLIIAVSFKLSRLPRHREPRLETLAGSALVTSSLPTNNNP